MQTDTEPAPPAPPRATPPATGAPATHAPAPAPGHRRPRRPAHRTGPSAADRVTGTVLIALVAVPLVVIAIAAREHHWTPTGDWALLELHTRDVGANTPLLGPYSRYGWNHPGPLLYYALAAPYRLLGGSAGALLAAAALVNLTAAVGMVWLAGRRGGTVLALLLAAGFGVLAAAGGASLLWDPWNPFVTLLPFAALVVCAWAVTDGEGRALPVVALLASFLVQTHVAYAALVAVPMVWAVVAVAVPVVRRRLAGRPGPPYAAASLAAAAMVLGLCWLPVGSAELGPDHNLERIVSYFTSPEPQPGVVDGLGLAARELIPPAGWTGRPAPNEVDGSLTPRSPNWLLLPLAGFALAAAAAWRTRARRALRFQLLVGGTTVAGLAATGRVTTPVYEYLVRWWWPLAVLLWVSILWSMWCAGTRWWADRRHRPPATVERGWRTRLAPAALVLVAWLAIAQIETIDAAPLPSADLGGDLALLADATVARLPRGGPIYVDATGSVWGTTGDAFRNELDRHGIPVAVDPAQADKYGPHRSADLARPIATLWVVTASAIDDWAARPDVCELARWDPMKPTERAEARVRAEALGQQLRAAGRDDLAENVRVGGSIDEAEGLPGVDHDLFDHVQGDRLRGDPIATFLGHPPRPVGSPAPAAPPTAAACYRAPVRVERAPGG